MKLFFKIRDNLTLLILGLYLLLDGSFMLLRIPPGGESGVPSAEILILLYIICLPIDLRWMKRFAAAAPLVPLLLWWSLGLTSAVLGYIANGIWALRDATSVIESLFIWIGFLVAGSPGGIRRVFTTLRRTINLSLIITFTWPFRGEIADLSPKITSANGIESPFFFAYQMNPILALAFSMKSLIRPVGKLTYLLAGFLPIYVAAILQARTIYLQILAMIALLAVVKPQQAFRLSGAFFLGIVIWAVLLAFNVPIVGRLGQAASLDFFVNHFTAIWGAGSDQPGLGGIQGAAEGVDQRLLWWRVIWDNLMSSVWNTMFGLGYGISLVGLAHDPSIAENVREPHNSLMSALGRTGFVGLALFIWVQASMAAIFVKTYVAYRRREDVDIRNWILVVILILILCWVNSIGEDAFEKPYLAVPYYFLCGVMLNLYSKRARVTAPRKIALRAVSVGPA